MSLLYVSVAADADTKYRNWTDCAMLEFAACCPVLPWLGLGSRHHMLAFPAAVAAR